MIGVEQLQSADAQFGDFLNEPIEPLPLRHRRCKYGRRTAGCFEFDITRRPKRHRRRPHNALPPPAPSKARSDVLSHS